LSFTANGHLSAVSSQLPAGHEQRGSWHVVLIMCLVEVMFACLSSAGSSIKAGKLAKCSLHDGRVHPTPHATNLPRLGSGGTILTVAAPRSAGPSHGDRNFRDRKPSC
jgi:hypothetical protein